MLSVPWRNAHDILDRDEFVSAAMSLMQNRKRNLISKLVLD